MSKTERAAMADRTPTDLERRLHEALVGCAVQVNWKFNRRRCQVCGRVWRIGEAANHAPDCLAAPDALEKGDER